jgi:hypothetical protein
VREADGDTAVLHTTQHHLFWVDGGATGWVPAGQLHTDDRLRTYRAGAASVGGELSFPGDREMYDLTVGGAHTFYVLAGDTPVLVHNRSCPAWVGGVLKALKGKKITTGILFKYDEAATGQTSPVVLQGATSSGENGDFAAIDAFLRTSPNMPPLKPGMPSYTASAHADTKLAWWLRQHPDIKKATMVINNADGACDFAYGCVPAIKAILYKDQTIEIFYPGALEAEPLVGLS